jgi:hypothetical protein
MWYSPARFVDEDISTAPQTSLGEITMRHLIDRMFHARARKALLQKNQHRPRLEGLEQRVVMSL